MQSRFFVTTGGMTKPIDSDTAYNAGVQAVKEWMAEPTTTGFGMITIISSCDPSGRAEILDDDLIILTEFLLQAGGFSKVDSETTVTL
jgi:hypothetical protein